MAPRGEDVEEDVGAAAPDAPTALEVSDWNETSVKLKWKAPAKDGGAPITFFMLEYKGKGEEEWQRSGSEVKPGKFPQGEVKELTTGTKYEFRVLAKNRAGESKPSEATTPLVVKAQKAAPKIDRSAMEEKAVKVNQQLDLAVPVIGEPVPHCWWLFNGVEIKSGDNVKVSSGNNVAKLLLIPAKRSHQGKYTCMAQSLIIFLTQNFLKASYNTTNLPPSY